MYTILILIFVSVMIWAFMSAAVITENFNRSQISGKEEEQKVDANGIIITETRRGNKYFEIYGETGHYDNDYKIATLNNVIGNCYKDNEVAMSFQSTKGQYNETNGSITLTSNIYIVLSNGITLVADKLIWYGNNKETVATGHVKIKKQGDLLAIANKCIINPTFDAFKIIGNTKTEIYNKGDNK